MKDYEINYLKKRLESERELLKENVEANRSTLKNLNVKGELNELSSYDNHPGDHGSELYEQELSQALKEHDLGRLKDVEDSLKRIQVGSYGVCHNCKKEIDFERLKASPTARWCIDCQESDSETVDPKDQSQDRPVEELSLGYPFGRTFTDGGDSLVYDGEDSWQDVEQYGSSSGPQDISVNRLIDYKNAYYDSEENIGLAEKIEAIDEEEFEDQK